MRRSARTYLPSGCLAPDWGQGSPPDLICVCNAPKSSFTQLINLILIYPNLFIRKSFSGNSTVNDRISKEAERGQYSRRN